MELVEVEITEVSRRSRMLCVSHNAVGLGRGLDPGEALLVLDSTGYYSATVTDIEFELDDTVYTLTLGGRVPEEIAEAQLDGSASAPHVGRFSIHDVVRLLGKAADEGRAQPSRWPDSPPQTSER